MWDKLLNLYPNVQGLIFHYVWNISCYDFCVIYTKMWSYIIWYPASVRLNDKIRLNCGKTPPSIIKIFHLERTINSECKYDTPNQAYTLMSVSTTYFHLEIINDSIKIFINSTTYIVMYTASQQHIYITIFFITFYETPWFYSHIKCNKIFRHTCFAEVVWKLSY